VSRFASSRSRSRLQYFVAVVWLALTVSLASWWMAVGLGRYAAPGMDVRRMFLWEGATFIGLLVGGGLAILLAIRREHQRRRALEMFFMSFTHDLKTSLASVQLQAESLHEDWPGALPRTTLDRLMQDLVRLQIQLENSLFVAQPDGRLLKERINVRSVFARLAEEWPALEVRVAGDAHVIADARAFDAVARNLLQNSVIHGGARVVTIEVLTRDALVRLRVVDDGKGVPVEVIPRLGEPFGQRGTTSGSGVGLFVCGQLVARMQGALRFGRSTRDGEGLMVELDLPVAR
jgi:signal transduction histidine kinase